MAGFLGPSRAKPVIPSLVQDLPCFFRNLIVDVKVAEDTLARVGDEDTIALLQQSAAKGMVICVNNPDDPDGKKELANLIARIRNRVDK